MRVFMNKGIVPGARMVVSDTGFFPVQDDWESVLRHKRSG